jgi:hypothetical protein
MYERRPLYRKASKIGDIDAEFFDKKSNHHVELTPTLKSQQNSKFSPYEENSFNNNNDQ